MSLVGKIVAPSLIVGMSAVALFQQRESLSNSSKQALVKGSVSLTACILLQVAVIRRSAMGGRPSNIHGVLALLYPLLFVVSMSLTFMLYRDVPPSVAFAFFAGPSRLGASGNQPVYQYRLTDVIDRVRGIVADRMKTSSDDFREL